MTEISLKNGVIQQTYTGKQSFNSVFESAAKVMTIADELKKEEKDIKVLVDIDKVTGASPDSLIAAADALNVKSEAKVAIYGGHSFIEKIAAFMISAVGKKESIRIFKSRQRAERWLESRQDHPKRSRFSGHKLTN